MCNSSSFSCLPEFQVKFLTPRARYEKVPSISEAVRVTLLLSESGSLRGKWMLLRAKDQWIQIATNTAVGS